MSNIATERLNYLANLEKVKNNIIFREKQHYKSKIMDLYLVAASPIAITISQSKFIAFLKPSRTSSSDAPNVPFFSKSKYPVIQFRVGPQLFQSYLLRCD